MPEPLREMCRALRQFCAYISTEVLWDCFRSHVVRRVTQCTGVSGTYPRQGWGVGVGEETERGAKPALVVAFFMATT